MMEEMKMKLKEKLLEELIEDLDNQEGMKLKPKEVEVEAVATPEVMEVEKPMVDENGMEDDDEDLKMLLKHRME